MVYITPLTNHNSTQNFKVDWVHWTVKTFADKKIQKLEIERVEKLCERIRDGLNFVFSALGTCQTSKIKHSKARNTVLTQLIGIRGQKELVKSEVEQSTHALIFARSHQGSKFAVQHLGADIQLLSRAGASEAKR